jgi:WD40 repeat protein
VCALPGLDAAGHPGGRSLLASAGGDGTVRMWDPATGRPVGEPLTESPASITAIAPPGATGGNCPTLAADGTVRSWTAATASLATIPAPRHASALAAHATTDHDVLLTGDAAGFLHTTDPATGRPLHPPVRVDDGAVLALCLLPGNPVTVAAAGRSGTITLHPLNPAAATTDPPSRLLGHAGPVRALCLIQPPGQPPLLASAGNDATIRIWDLHTAAPCGGPLTGHDGWIWSLTALPSLPGQAPHVASAGADATIRLWDPLIGQQIGQPLTGHTDQVRALACVTAAGVRALLVSGGHDGTVRLWNPATGQHLRAIPLAAPVHALLQQPPDPRSRERTDNGATVTVGLRTGVLALDLHSSLFPPYLPQRDG